MKIARWLAAAVLFSSPLLAQEGVATFKVVTHMNEGDMPGTSKITFSRSGWRVDMHMDLAGMSKRRERSAMPPDFDTTMLGKLSEPEKVYMLNTATKTYSVIDTTKSSDSQSDETWTVKRTGRGSVAGLSCESATLTSAKGTQVDVCVSNEFPNSSGWWSAMNRRRSDSWVKRMGEAGLKGFPIKMAFRGRTGTNEMEMELVSLDRRSVAASSFEVPAGYKQSSPGMGMMSPEQQKRMNDQLSKMTPEQRKAYEDAMKRAQQPQ